MNQVQVPLPQGQAAQPPQIRPLRPEQMRSISYLTPEERAKYEEGLRQLYAKMEQNAPDTPEHRTAKQKIAEFSRMVFNKIKTIQARNQAASQGQGQGQPSQAAQTQLNTQPQAGQAQKTAIQPPTQGNPSAPAPNAVAAPNQTSQTVPKNIIDHVSKLPWQNLRMPPQVQQNQAGEWLNSMRQRYARNLMTMEAIKTRGNKFEAMVKERQENGQLTQEVLQKYQDQKAAEQKQYAEAERFVTSVRNQMKAQPGVSVQGTSTPQQGRSQPMQPQNVSAPASHPMQAATASVNAAMDAAKSQQLAASRPTVPTVPTGPQQIQVLQQQSQVQPQSHQAHQAHQAQPHHPGTPVTPATPSAGPQHHQQQQPPVQPQPQPHSVPAPTSQSQLKNETAGNMPNNMPHPPPVNTALAAATAAAHMPSAGTPTQASARVQTPQSAGQQPQGAQVRPLTHAAAVNRANSSTNISSQANSASGGLASTPGSGGLVNNANHPSHSHAHPQSNTPAALNPKMPINKNLPPKATETPQPVATGGGYGPGRPSLTGGGATIGGTMSQPVIPKMPPVQFDADGEHVLSKKKLDELVRQVCGGGSPGADGNYLTPDVEESVLNVADNFVDNVIHSACRLAKERGSKVLEIRDIQLVLERVYNMRIPGYTSDELRTVRKIQPAQSWISKVHAVQAAKVMPGKDEK
ncbi:transcription initiation factor TFIID subunit A-domain-containing protein [Hypomontagnella submonticulosa]|nr:transcription initiation factor TFIID subunit A-domain-containing protein [Hypomontagnella submonticulosa]